MADSLVTIIVALVLGGPPVAYMLREAWRESQATKRLSPLWPAVAIAATLLAILAMVLIAGPSRGPRE